MAFWRLRCCEAEEDEDVKRTLGRRDAVDAGRGRVATTLGLLIQIIYWEHKYLNLSNDSKRGVKPALKCRHVVM